jgi:hypothetical protein
MDETMVDRLRAMLRQESRFYQIDSCNHHPLFKTPSSQDSSSLAVDESCRRAISHWCVSFCDVCGIDQETAATAIRNLDRYTLLSSSSSLSALNSKTEYQVVSMTLLYTTIKVMETNVVSPQALANVSRGTCVASDIIDMESTILEELEWHLYPPTAFGFVRCILKAFEDDALPERVRDSALQQAFDSIHEAKLIPFPSSIVAMAAIANALDENKANIDSAHIIWLTLLEAMEGISCDDFFHVRQVLWKVRLWKVHLSKMAHLDENTTKRTTEERIVSPSSSMTDLSDKNSNLSSCLTTTIDSQDDDLLSGCDISSSCESIVISETTESPKTQVHILFTDEETECVLERISHSHHVRSPTCVMAPSCH